MYLRATPSPLAPAQVVENRIVWISKRTVLNNLTWVGGWGEEEDVKKKKERTKTTICFRCLASCDLRYSVSVKTTSDYFHGKLVLWIFRCATVLGDVVYVFIPLTSLAVMSVLVIGFQYCK